MTEVYIEVVDYLSGTQLHLADGLGGESLIGSLLRRRDTWKHQNKAIDENTKQMENTRGLECYAGRGKKVWLIKDRVQGTDKRSYTSPTPSPKRAQHSDADKDEKSWWLSNPYLLPLQSSAFTLSSLRILAIHPLESVELLD